MGLNLVAERHKRSPMRCGLPICQLRSDRMISSNRRCADHSLFETDPSNHVNRSRAEAVSYLLIPGPKLGQSTKSSRCPTTFSSPVGLGPTGHDDRARMRSFCIRNWEKTDTHFNHHIGWSCSCSSEVWRVNSVYAPYMGWGVANFLPKEDHWVRYSLTDLAEESYFGLCCRCQSRPGSGQTYPAVNKLCNLLAFQGSKTRLRRRLSLCPGKFTSVSGSCFCWWTVIMGKKQLRDDVKSTKKRKELEGPEATHGKP